MSKLIFKRIWGSNPENDTHMLFSISILTSIIISMIKIQFVKFEKKDKFCPYSQAIFPVKFF